MFIHMSLDGKGYSSQIWKEEGPGIMKTYEIMEDRLLG